MSSGDRAKRRSGSRSASTSVGEEDKLGSVSGGAQSAAGGKEADLVVAVDVGKEDAPVLEVEQAGERSRLHHVLEEVLGRVVGGDAGGEYAWPARPRSFKRFRMTSAKTA